LDLNQKKNSVSSQLPVQFYNRDNYIRTYSTYQGDTMSEELQQTEVAPEAAQQPAAEQASNELTINDLNAMKVIIDIASSRGAFKPNEMVAVGQTYTKLSSFLEQVAKQAEAQKAAATAAGA
jgi:hypothetical protein